MRYAAANAPYVSTYLFKNLWGSPISIARMTIAYAQKAQKNVACTVQFIDSSIAYMGTLVLFAPRARFIA